MGDGPGLHIFIAAASGKISRAFPLMHCINVFDTDINYWCLNITGNKE